jgi:hypothetical protein
MAPAKLTKSHVLAFRQCPKRLWLAVHGNVATGDSAAAQLAREQGKQVGLRARLHFGNGTLIETRAPAAARAQTQALLARRAAPLFEAAFEHADVFVRTDVLAPADHGWRLIEVKSAAGVKDHHVDDVAVQQWVLRGTGLQPRSASLMHVSAGWIYPGGSDFDGLFTEVDVTDRATALLPAVGEWVDGASAVLANAEPDVPMGAQCNAPVVCPYQVYCEQLTEPAAYPVTLLPNNAGKKLARRLAAAGVRDLREVLPDELGDSAEFVRIHRATVSGEPFLDPAAAEALARLPWPRAYLDFETIALAVPRWPGTRPFEHVPFQWSCDVENEMGALRHTEFLDLSGGDPRHACAHQLIQTLAGAPVVIAYNASFERDCLRALAAAVPDLAVPLNTAADALFDLLPLVRAHYYHRDMLGSRSIKQVLPTMLGADPYAQLAGVAEGASAQLAYLEAIDTATGVARRFELDAQLRAYCRLDTWAMVAAARFLARKPLPAAP